MDHTTRRKHSRSSAKDEHRSRSKSKKRKRSWQRRDTSSSSTESSSSFESDDRRSKNKSKHRKSHKHKKTTHLPKTKSKKKRCSSSESSSSSRERKKKKKKKKKLKRDKKKEKEKLKVKEMHSPLMISAASTLDGHGNMGNQHKSKLDPVIGPAPRILKPMSKEEWEKQQSVMRHVYDPETGRTRLIKGDGEIMEEIVSRDRHLEINKQATHGDGVYYQTQAGLLK